MSSGWLAGTIDAIVAIWLVLFQFPSYLLDVSKAEKYLLRQSDLIVVN